VPVDRGLESPYRPLVALAGVILTCAALYWAQKILIPIALAILLAFVLSPAVHALQHRGLGRVPSVLIVVTLAFAVLAGVGVILSLQIKGLANDLPKHEDTIVAKIAGLLGSGQQSSLGNLEDTIRDIAQRVRLQRGPPEKEPAPVRVIAATDYRQMLGQLRDAAGPAAEGLATTGLVVILVIFILVKREDLRNRLVHLIGQGRLIVTTRAIDEAAQRISKYLIVQLCINAGVGLVMAVGLFLLGIPYALLWGFLIALLRFVPFIGIWLAASVLVLFSVVVFPGWLQAALVVGLIALVEVVTANIIEPLLFGHSTGISSVALLVAAAFWTWLWGPIGLVLSTPMTACLVVLGKYVPPLAFFNILLGDEPVLEAEVTYYQRLLARDQDEAAELVETHLQDHSLETVYDEVLIPALVLAKRDRENGQLSRDQEQFILQATREVLNDLVLPHQRTQCKEKAAGVRREQGPPGVVVFGCPVRDAEDELAMEMLSALLQETCCRMEVLSAQTLSGELVARADQEHAALICISALPPSGLAQARYLCKRLRLHFPDAKIAVGIWGETEQVEKARQRLRAAGADAVGTRLLETRDQVVPMIQVLSHVDTDQANDPGQGKAFATAAAR
jgi:predicted PurR-regulated permease PerM